MSVPFQRVRVTADRERVVLAVAVVAVMLAQVQLYPGIAELVEALGASTDLDASMWFLAAELTAYVLCAGLWGAASDSIGRRVPLIVAAAGTAAVSYLALAILPAAFELSFAAVLVLRAVQGGATVGVLSLSMTMLMDLEGGHGRNMGAAGIAIGLGVAAGAPIGGQLSAVDPLAPLYAAAALMLVGGGAVATASDRAPTGSRTVRRALARIRRTPSLSVPYAFGFVDRLTAGFFSLVGTFYLRSTFDLDPMATGVTLAMFFAPFALLQYPAGTLSDRVGRTAPIVVGSICYGVALAAVAFAPTLTLARATMVVVGVLGALVSPATMALVTDLVPDDERGVAMAGFNVAGSLGFLTGVVLGGSLADAFGYPTAFVAVGALELAIAVAALPALLRLTVSVGGPATAE